MSVFAFIGWCLFSFLFGFLFLGTLFISYYESKFQDYLDWFERRVDFTFEKYFWFPLFPKEDK